jgi:diguanylate cyclase (GGDEF)-like protein
MHLTRVRIVSVLLLTVATTFLLSVAWEYGLEEYVSKALSLPYEEHFEEDERWRFILTSTGFAFISLTVPALLLLYMFGRLQGAYTATITAQELASSLARHDALTGLPNRRVFADELRHAIQESEAEGNDCAVLLIDLDRFKFANDMHGHQAGDSVLCEVADRLRALLPPGATLARLGGDEFAMIVAGDSQREFSVRLAQRIITALSIPIPVGNIQVDIGATIGIALRSPENSDPEALLRAADIAMYRTKRDGRGSFQFFEETMDRELKARAHLELDLRKAVANDEIQPFYQPLVSLPDRTLQGFEILARWPRPQGLIPPDIFIPIAEDTGLIADLTYRILRRACLDARSWPAPLMLSLNVSPTQLMDATLPQRILAILTETGFPAARLEIEITENAIMNNMETAQATLMSLHNMGVSIALDDFGTGYSSLSHLRKLRFDKIKIDRSFVMSMHESDDSRKLVDAIIGLGKSLKLPTTAEGIETEENAVWLAENGCTSGQGYLFGKAMPAAEVADFLRRDDVIPSAAPARALAS